MTAKNLANQYTGYYVDQNEIERALDVLSAACNNIGFKSGIVAKVKDTMVGTHNFMPCEELSVVAEDIIDSIIP